MLLRFVLISTVLSVISFTGNLSAQTAAPHDPETEQDYGPGFWNTDVDTTLEDEQGGEFDSELIIDQEENSLLRDLLAPFIKSAQTYWNECDDSLTANF